MNKKISLVMMTSMLLVTSVGASTLSDKKNELKDTQTSISAFKSQLNETVNEKNEIVNQVDVLDKQIIEEEELLSELEIKLKQKEKDVDIAQEELNASKLLLEEATQNRELQYGDTKARMAQMYRNRKVGFLQMIFSSKNLFDALNKAEYIKKINGHDNRTLTKLTTIEQEVEEATKAVEAKTLLLEEEKSILEETVSQQQASVNKLESMIASKVQSIKSLESKERSIENQLDEMQQLEKSLESDIKRLTAQSTVQYNGGSFGWPVPGNYRVSSDYGYRNSPIFGKQEFHTGIDIPAGYGTPVVASADGKVIFSGTKGGYGLSVMIDHGGGLVTLYAHNSTLIAKVGDTVKKGETVSKIGSTGWSTGNHLHFQFYKNGVHSSPWNYVKK